MMNPITYTQLQGDMVERLFGRHGKRVPPFSCTEFDSENPRVGALEPEVPFSGLRWHHLRMDNVPPRKKSKKQLKDTITIEAKSPEDETATEKATFESLGLMESLVESCERLKWKAPTDIQQASIPWALKGRDIIGLAKTGSGKTGAFVLPILQALLKAPQNLFALIIAPTRFVFHGRLF